MLGAMAVATVLSPSLGWISFFLASLVDAFGVLIGIPFATAVAVLTFGLYDVGFVVRKQVVSVVLTIAFVLLFVLLVFSVGSLVAVRGEQALAASSSAACSPASPSCRCAGSPCDSRNG